jgi:hypothetical protein
MILHQITVNDEIVQTLRMIQSVGFSSAIIAGGAVRDLYLGKDISDIDIFVWDPEFSTETLDYGYHDDFSDYDGVAAWWEILGLDDPDLFNAHDTIEQCFDGYMYSDTSEKITRMWNIHKEGIKYQIIFTRVRPEEHIKKYFNIGLCKAYCNGTKFTLLPDFIKDAKRNTLTIVGQDMTQWEFDYTVNHHIPKLKLKYPNFTMKIAPHNQKFIR